MYLSAKLITINPFKNNTGALSYQQSYWIINCSRKLSLMTNHLIALRKSLWKESLFLEISIELWQRSKFLAKIYFIYILPFQRKTSNFNQSFSIWPLSTLFLPGLKVLNSGLERRGILSSSFLRLSIFVAALESVQRILELSLNVPFSFLKFLEDLLSGV